MTNMIRRYRVLSMWDSGIAPEVYEAFSDVVDLDIHEPDRELYQETGQKCWLDPIYKALKFAMSVQFTEPQDANLKGCILEKVLPPEGSDASPYYIRDLGTIFYIQAVTELLAAVRGCDLKA